MPTNESPTSYERDVEFGGNVHNDKVPNSLDLGLFHSRKKNEVQMAKVSQRDRATHLYAVGGTGTGKTKFLEFMIRQDIANVRGFAVIDPHGDLVEDIRGYLAGCYYSRRDKTEVSERVVLIDPTDPVYTVTFNPLERIPGVSVAEQAGELISSFRKIWSDSWGARMEDLMRNSLIALGEAEMTLSELAPFLTRRAFRQVVLEKVENPTAIDYFRRFDTLTDRAQIPWIEPVMNKINAFLADERIRLMFSGSKSSFNLRNIMDTGKHLLIKLNKGKLKSSADLLGSLFMAKIQMTAFSRSDVPPHQRVPFYLYIDEFQNFATDSFEVILSEARKYGLSLVMAHQSLSQIPDNLRGLILSSAGLQVYFRVNRQDASILAKEAFTYSGFETEPDGEERRSIYRGRRAGGWENKISQLQHLPPRTCFAKHKTQGGIIQLRTVSIAPPWKSLGIGESEFQKYLATVPFGAHYLRSREELIAESSDRRKAIEGKVRSAPQPIESQPIVEPAPQVEVFERPVAKLPATEFVAPVAVSMPPEPDKTVERQHRRLQHLIKQLAEKGGYRAIIEQPTDDGQGRVDVALESDGRRIACEVSVTTSPEQELANIRKCLASGYENVVMCSPQRKSLEKIRNLCAAEMSQSDGQKVLFLEPDELILFFEEEAARSAGKTGTVKGYKVKLNYQPLKEADKLTKREAITKAILQSFEPRK